MSAPLHAPPRRIAIVSDAAPERNGVGTYYRDLAEHLTVHVPQVIFFAPLEGDPPLGHWLDLPLPGDGTQRLGVPSPRQFRRRFHELAPDAVIIATPGPYGLLGARLAAQRPGTRLVFGLHTHYEALSKLYWGPVLSRVNRWGLGAFNRRLCRQADAVITNSHRLRPLAHGLGARAVHVVGTLLPRAFMTSPPALPERLETVLFVGRLAAEKRVETVLEAAARLPALRFRIAGDGPQRLLVERAAARLSNLDYLGWLPRHRLRETIDAAQLLVLPSLVEAFGTAAFEALARGRPALVSAGCGIRDWPALAAGLHLIDAAEHPATAIDRIAAMDPALRRARAELGRQGVASMIADGVAQWRGVLAGERPVDAQRDLA